MSTGCICVSGRVLCPSILPQIIQLPWYTSWLPLQVPVRLLPAWKEILMRCSQVSTCICWQSQGICSSLARFTRITQRQKRETLDSTRAWNTESNVLESSSIYSNTTINSKSVSCFLMSAHAPTLLLTHSEKQVGTGTTPADILRVSKTVLDSPLVSISANIPFERQYLISIIPSVTFSRTK